MRHLTVTGSLHGRAHRPDALGHQRRLAHQARAEAAALHAIARAAAIQIDLVVAELRSGARRAGQLVGIAAAELQRHRVLGRMEFQQARSIAPHDRRRGDHLGVQQRARAQQPQEIAAVPVRVVHHRRDVNSSV